MLTAAAPGGPLLPCSLPTLVQPPVPCQPFILELLCPVHRAPGQRNRRNGMCALVEQAHCDVVLDLLLVGLDLQAGRLRTV